MKKVISYFLNLGRFDGAWAGGKAFKVENPPYMDLHISYYLTRDGVIKIAVGHYGIQNGDLMADPEMEFTYDPRTGKLTPETYRNDYVGVFDDSPGNVDEREEFARLWEKNLVNQGFLKAKEGEGL